MLEKAIPFFRKPGIMNPIAKLGSFGMNLLDFPRYKMRGIEEQNRALYETRQRRILDTIGLQKAPDRVPVITNGLNFFPAHYAGISTYDYMFDHKKLHDATFKFINDFDFDMYFLQYMFGIGDLVHFAEFNLLKLPGIDLDPHSPYQYNEIDRLNSDEYERFQKEGMQFLINTLSPRCAGLFKYSGLEKLRRETLLLLKFMKFGRFVIQMQNEMQARGAYCIFGTTGFPPFDIFSFAFRSMESIARDMMKRDTKERMIDLMRRMNPWLVSLWTLLPKISHQPGVWFTSERAFSLSPKQFEKFYWPTLKQMILAMVNDGLIPFLTWESDVTHLLPFLLELPKSVSRRCVFNCDTSDIYQAKKLLEDHMCVAGNIPLSTMCVGTPHDVEKACEKLFAGLKGNGGYILNPALGIPDDAKPENIHAMINYAKKYGKY